MLLNQLSQSQMESLAGFEFKKSLISFPIEAKHFQRQGNPCLCISSLERSLFSSGLPGREPLTYTAGVLSLSFKTLSYFSLGLIMLQSWALRENITSCLSFFPLVHVKFRCHNILLLLMRLKEKHYNFKQSVLKI